MIKIDLKVFNAVLKFAGKRENNEILKCVHIFDREDKRIYEATNGHYLARVITDKPNDGATYLNICIYPKEKIKGTYAYIADDNCLRNDSGLYYVEAYDGADYKDTDRILQEMEIAKPAKHYLCFNPNYLKRVADFFGGAWYGIQPPLQQDFSAWGGNPAYNPCFWKFENKIVALMPVRI